MLQIEQDSAHLHGRTLNTPDILKSFLVEIRKQKQKI